MIDKYKDDILKLITQNGPLGVNAISRELNVPLSTLQKYLHKQTYFKINDDRKWDLPEKVQADIKSNTLELMTNVVENSILLLKSQLEEMLHTADNALAPISTLKKGIVQISGVAGVQNAQITIDPRLLNINEMKYTLNSIFRKQKANIPEEYVDLVFKFDYVGLVLKDGEEYTKSFLEDGLYELLAGSATELSEDTIEILKANQIS